MAITVQVVKFTGSNTSSVTSSGITTAGTTAIATSAHCDSGVTANTPTDSKSNAYGTAKSNQTQGSTRLAVWEKDNAAVGSSHTFTQTFSAATYPTCFAVACAGTATAAYDSGSFAQLASGSGNPFTCNTAGQAQANNVVLSFIGTDVGTISSFSNSNTGLNANITAETDTSNYWCGAVAWKLISTTSAEGSAWSVNPGAANAMVVSFALKEGAGGGGDVTAALTGVSATGSVGTVGPAADAPLTGNAATGSVGTVAPDLSAALTGNVGTGQTGTLTPELSVSITGAQGTASVGTLTPALSLGLAGVEGTGDVGTLTASAGSDVTVALTGVSAAGEVGDLAPSTSAGLSGVAAAGQVGDVLWLSRDVVVALTGVSAFGQVGDVSVAGAAPAERNMGFEIRSTYRKPLLRRILEERYPKVKPRHERAQKRAKAIELEAVELVLEQPQAESAFAALQKRWAAERPVVPPALADVDPMALFRAQIAFRLRQQQLEEQALAMLAAQRRRQEEDALIALLLA